MFANLKELPVLTTVSRALEQNKAHVFRFVYLTGGTVLQIAVLNFIIYPYLSRRIPDEGFGELLLIMTTINFYISAFGAPAAMAFYRHISTVPDAEAPHYFGSMLYLMVFGLTILSGINLLAYDVIARYWHLTFSRLDIFYLLCYMVFYVVDMLLLIRIQYDYNFKVGFYSRIIFFICSFIIIPMYIYFPGNWLIAFTLAPAASSLFLFVVLFRTGSITHAGLSITRHVRSISKDYFYFSVTCVSSQLIVYCDRWVLASFDVSKAEIAYFTIAVQACTLIIFPVDRLGDLMMPSVSNIRSFNEISIAQARKSLLALAASMGYVVTFGFFIGFIFFKLYKPAYFEHGWRYFVIMLAGTFFYAVQSSSRSYLVKFFPISRMLVTQTVAALMQIGITILLFSISGDTISAAIGKMIGYIVIAVIYYWLCQNRIMKIAFAK